MQTEFEIGDVNIWQSENNDSVLPDDPRLLIPGRTVILEQNKNDMGAHRFTWADRNLIIAATDMPDYDDRPPSKEHYSKTHEKAGVYGMRKLYTDTKRANEEIRIVVEQLQVVLVCVNGLVKVCLVALTSKAGLKPVLAFGRRYLC